MTSLFPWSGLSAAVGRLDLWAVINLLGGPLLAAGADEAGWLGAGLPFDLLPALRQARVDCGGTQLGASSGLWPSRLTGQPFGAVLLGVEGNIALLQRPAVAIVGARSRTPYGLEHAGAIAQAVVGAGGVLQGTHITRVGNALLHEALFDTPTLPLHPALVAAPAFVF